jgi:hypothetical protein
MDPNTQQFAATLINVPREREVNYKASATLKLFNLF